MHLKYFIIDSYLWLQRTLLNLTNDHPARFKVYGKTILPLRRKIFLARGGMDSIVMMTTTLSQSFETCVERLGDRDEVNRLRADMIDSYILYGIDPVEYYLFGFKDKDHDQRRQWLSDRERCHSCFMKMGKKTFHELRDKSVFYEMAKPFFKRDVYVVGPDSSEETFFAFVGKHPVSFAKPVSGTLGMGAGIHDVASYSRPEDMFDHFRNSGKWMLEEMIDQDPRMAVWNKTSVNTIRIPSFMTSTGEHVVLCPTIRTGREGSVVDNAGAGGITALIDENTGRITGPGIDKSFHRYDAHPDANVYFLGWQVPEWEELMKTVEAVHRSLPARHRYVGFDFALSKEGWVLIEGNWGQLVGAQVSSGHGLRHEYEKLMGLPEDTCLPRSVIRR